MNFMLVILEENSIVIIQETVISFDFAFPSEGSFNMFHAHDFELTVQWKCLQNDTRVPIKCTFGWFLIWQFSVSVRMSDIHVRKLWMKHSRLNYLGLIVCFSNFIDMHLIWLHLHNIFHFICPAAVHGEENYQDKSSYMCNLYGDDIFVYLRWNE